MKVGERFKLKPRNPKEDPTIFLITGKVNGKDELEVFNFSENDYETLNKFSILQYKDYGYVTEDINPGDSVLAMELQKWYIGSKKGKVVTRCYNHDGVALYNVKVEGRQELQEFFEGELVKIETTETLTTGDLVQINEKCRYFLDQGIVDDYDSNLGLYDLRDSNGNYMGFYTRESLSRISRPQKVDKTPQCSHQNKYKNVLSAHLRFWYCPDCKQDLGDA